MNKELMHDQSTPTIPDGLGDLAVSKLADFISILVIIGAAVAYFLTR